ncbi:MAG TPA: SDR family oxidoreductase [Acidobacteriaceae bacterium]|nr:SDR family oxidoreductase [Acidobacteriaceae bacterium]
MLQQRVIVVTGGATGIGRGICDALAAKGARIAVVQPELSVAQKAAAEIPGAHGFAADIRSRPQVERMIGQVISTFGYVDGLVNNASITGETALGAFATMPPDQVEEIIDTNLKGTVWCSQAVSRFLIERQSPGCIVHIASVGAFAAQELAAVYCASKAAQVSLAQSMALELAPHNILVNAVAPGDILTKNNGPILEKAREKGSTGLYTRRTPLGHRGTPKDIGNAVVFLFSPEAAFITGTTLTVDGGFLSY